MSRYAVLMGQIEHELQELEQLVIQTIALVQKVKITGDTDYLGTVALNLHGYYSGAERIFREVALELDGGLPQGSDWHRRLLRQMAVEVPDTRPAIMGDITLKALSDLCAFRHVVRNVYTFDLIPTRVETLATELPEIHQRLQADLIAFCQFLAAINGE